MTEPCKQIFSDDVINNVQRTWSLINSNLQVVGIDILIRLFEKYPDYQSLFKNFKDVSTDELKTNSAFLRHALAVATALDVAISNLNDTDKLVPLLTDVGKSHGKRSVTAEQFQNLQCIVLEAVTDILKEHCTEQVRQSWTQMLNIAISTIVKGLDQVTA